MLVSRKEARNRCDAKGKSALTHFYCICTKGDESLVACFPKTGRTHQIRLHLEYSGFPITNDPLYGGVSPADENMENVLDDEEKHEGKAKRQKVEKADIVEKGASGDEKKRFQLHEVIPKRVADDTNCRLLYLHALHLRTSEFEYTAPWPTWADEMIGDVDKAVVESELKAKLDR
mmetsp:Transcript_1125/g.2422  ORF Transcript_1125/g.2422 Transcript_1125/m.2422 type:complete len:175 (-) Transcript_1125:1442-1966(-)